MNTTSVTRETVTRKALRLYPERTVEPAGHGRYSVEGSAADYYEVDLGIDGGEESCDCPATKPCYHIALATIYRAKIRTAARRVQAAKTAGRATRGNLEPLVASCRSILAGLLFAAPFYALWLILALLTGAS